MSATYPAWAWKAENFFRSLIGFVVAPIAGGILAGAAAAFVGLLNADQNSSSFTDVVPLFVFMGGVFGANLGIPVALVFGWPIHGLLMWRRYTHVAVYAAAAGGLASLGFALVAPTGVIPLQWTWQSAAVAAAAGVFGGVTFWLIRRPDQDAPKADAVA